MLVNSSSTLRQSITYTLEDKLVLNVSVGDGGAWVKVNPTYTRVMKLDPTEINQIKRDK